MVSISPAADSSVEEAGVVLFWSPELVQQQIVNHKVDVWALGIVILEVLNGGKAPYEDDKFDEEDVKYSFSLYIMKSITHSLEQIKQRILEWGRPEYPPNLPPSLVDLLNHCLEVDPKARWSASAILQHNFLKDYEPELLFSTTGSDGAHESNDEEVEYSSQSDTLEENMMQDIESIDQKELNIIEDMQCIEEETISVAVLSPSMPSNLPTPLQQEEKIPAKCRLPLPAFSVDQQMSASVPVKEKIANVIRKRQTMTDANRSQGSRIPMLCNLQPMIQQQEEKIHKLRSVKSVKLPSAPPQQKKSLSGGENTMPRKPLTRSNTVPSNIRTNDIKTVPKRVSTRSPLNDISEKPNIRKAKAIPSSTQKKELPPKSSIYRHKRLPAGESRTARLMMGVSTNGRRQSFRQRDEHEKETSPTLGHRFGKIFGNKKELSPLPTITTPNTKRRPISFAASSSSLPKYNSDPSIKSIPTTPRTRRQSVPAPPSSKAEENNSKKKSTHGIKTNVKILRVH